MWIWDYVATAGLVVLPWMVHQVTTYGWADPLATSRHASVVLDQARFPGLSPDYIGAFSATSFHSFWAQFGWMGVVAPDRLYWAWGLLTLIAVLGLVIDRRLFRSQRGKILGPHHFAGKPPEVGYERLLVKQKAVNAMLGLRPVQVRSQVRERIEQVGTAGLSRSAIPVVPASPAMLSRDNPTA